MSGAVLQFSKYGKTLPKPLLVTTCRADLRFEALGKYLKDRGITSESVAILDDDKRLLAMPVYINIEALARKAQINTYITADGKTMNCWQGEFDKFLTLLDSIDEFDLATTVDLEKYISEGLKNEFLAQILQAKQTPTANLPQNFLSTLRIFLKLTNFPVDGWPGMPDAHISQKYPLSTSEVLVLCPAHVGVYDEADNMAATVKWLRYLAYSEIRVHNLTRNIDRVKDLGYPAYLSVDMRPFAEAIMRDFFSNPERRKEVLKAVLTGATPTHRIIYALKGRNTPKHTSAPDNAATLAKIAAPAPRL
jgi:hypothetical protein